MSSRHRAGALAELIGFMENETLQLSRYPADLKLMMRSGSNTDEIEGSFGEFGLNLTNPIPVNGPIGEVIYLSSLRYHKTTKLLFHKIGASEGIDVFESVSEDGQVWDIFYLDMFHPRRSRRSPSGYSLTEELSFLTGVNFELPDFPYGLSDATAKYTEQLVGFSCVEAKIKEAEKSVRFIRPHSHLGFLEDLHRGNIQRDPMSRRSG